MQRISHQRSIWIWRSFLALVCISLFFACRWIVAREQRRVMQSYGIVLKMPGKSFSGPLPPLTATEHALAVTLRAHVENLASKIGERNVGHHRNLYAAARYVENVFNSIGLKPARQTFNAKGRECENLIVEIPGTTKPNEIVIVGAHYDSAPRALGANDNGSGMAALFELARMFAKNPAAHTLRFVAFTNEEQPYFQSELMGSLVYAKSLKAAGEKVNAMICLETIGYYRDEPRSQKYPAPFSSYYPTVGNFIGFVSNTQSARLVERTVKTFREKTAFPSEGGALPAELEGVGWSDHWSFWQQGYPAVMVTDTAMFRYPYYHTMQDTPDKLDYDRMARVTLGLEKVIRDLASDVAD
jgi:Zn-dependent M28 family amino/carboxypeptidase